MKLKKAVRNVRRGIAFALTLFCVFLLCIADWIEVDSYSGDE